MHIYFQISSYRSVSLHNLNQKLNKNKNPTITQNNNKKTYAIHPTNKKGKIPHTNEEAVI